MVLFVVSTAFRGSLALSATPFAWAMFVVLTFSALAAPVPTLADTVVSAATTDKHQYGRCRLWGAVWWGTISLVSGVVLERYGFNAAFLLYFCSSMPGALPQAHNVYI